MPIYLCQPGIGSKEPWRHGVQVYAHPFPLGGQSECESDNDVDFAGDVDVDDPAETRVVESRVEGSAPEGMRGVHPSNLATELVAPASATGAIDTTPAAAASAAVSPRTGLCPGPANDGRSRRGLLGDDRVDGRGEDGREALGMAGGTDVPDDPNDVDDAAREGRGRGEAHQLRRQMETQIFRQRRFVAARALENSTFSNSNSSLDDEMDNHDNGIDTNNDNDDNDDNNAAQDSQQLHDESQSQNSQVRRRRRRQRELHKLPGQQQRHRPTHRLRKQRQLPPVRRVRHAEVVLVDQVLVAFRRHWLRLRWPGEHGGFGGFVALGEVEEDRGEGGMGEVVSSGMAEAGVLREGGTRSPDFARDASREAEVNVGFASLKAAPTAGNTASVPLLLCQETNVPYPTSLAMKLLPRYDDGLGMDCGPAAGAEDSIVLEESFLGSVKNGEPVFCRICREGLHDVNYDLETTTSAAPQNHADEDLSSHTADARRRGTDSSAGASTHDFAGGEGVDRDQGAVTAASAVVAIPSDKDHKLSSTRSPNKTMSSTKTTSTPLASLPPLVLHHPTAENPLLAPCKCAGSMAFVHYLCIEQWRCRSRHPAAKNGLHCETCGAEYTLPPPPSRPTHPNDPFHNNDINNGDEPGNIMFEDDWLAAMPPHVLAALRRPHPWWQLGAAIVRRKYLRPLVPVFISPLVALYCRGRRTLKKRGVSRRRWACSLCRRRARWKCVRCLRSYYCSRQCQNVSWHIVHKHVCYKPARFWWSVVVYSVGGVLAVPGLLKEPLVYDFMLTFLPMNFLAMGIIAGGIAMDMKRLFAVDIRGRTLEGLVVLLTLWLTSITSKLVRGYFGDPSQCWGVFAPDRLSSAYTDGLGETILFGDRIPALDSSNPVSLLSSPFNFLHGTISNILFFIATSFLRCSQIWFEKWDHYVFSRLGFISRRVICTPTLDGSTDYMSDGCFPSVRSIDPNFFLEEGNESCRADMSFMLFLYAGSLAFLAYGSLDRHRRGRARNAGGHRGHRERRPHQD
ncbi:hypothetical protein ACHAXS_005787 [Conticribra weissflogii]